MQANRAASPRAPRRSDLRGSCALLFEAVRERAALEMDQEERDRRGRDSLYPRCLPHGLGPMLRELLLSLLGQAAHRCIVEVRRKRQFLLSELPLDFILLPFDIAR